MTFVNRFGIFIALMFAPILAFGNSSNQSTAPWQPIWSVKSTESGLELFNVEINTSIKVADTFANQQKLYPLPVMNLTVPAFRVHVFTATGVPQYLDVINYSFTRQPITMGIPLTNSYALAIAFVNGSHLYWLSVDLQNDLMASLTLYRTTGNLTTEITREIRLFDELKFFKTSPNYQNGLAVQPVFYTQPTQAIPGSAAAASNQATTQSAPASALVPSDSWLQPSEAKFLRSRYHSQIQNPNTSDKNPELWRMALIQKALHYQHSLQIRKADAKSITPDQLMYWTVEALYPRTNSSQSPEAFIVTTELKKPQSVPGEIPVQIILRSPEGRHLDPCANDILLAAGYRTKRSKTP